MAVTREEYVDSIEIRPKMNQIGVKTAVVTSEDGVEVRTDFLTAYYSSTDDISSLDSQTVSIMNHYWSL